MPNCSRFKYLPLKCIAIWSDKANRKFKFIVICSYTCMRIYSRSLVQFHPENESGNSFN